MNDSRELFLKYCKDKGLLPGTVLTEIWQAAERQALKRAYSAVKALRQTNTFRVDSVAYMNEGIDNAADAIRALIEQSASKES